MDLIDLYITKNTTDPKLFIILKTLLDQFEHSVNWKDTKTIMNRIQSSLGRIYKFKEYGLDNSALRAKRPSADHFV